MINFYVPKFGDNFKIKVQRLVLLKNYEQMEVDENMNNLDLLPTG